MAMLSPEDVWLEAPDVTASEEHQELAFRIEAALKALVPEPSAVIGATFLVAPDEKPVSADILVAVGSEPGKRPSWRLPRDPVPDVTIEIVSPSNRTGEGKRLVEEKRGVYGRIGIPEHLELDPNEGTIDVWVSRDGGLVRVAKGLRRYLSTRLYGAVIEADEANNLQILTPDGNVFPLPQELFRQMKQVRTELARVAAERDDLASERDATAERVMRLRESAMRLRASVTRLRASVTRW